MAPWIASFIPKKIMLYVEPYFGGGSVFFYLMQNGWDIKSPLLNDLDDNVFSFFVELRDNHKKLKKMLDNTPYSRRDFELACSLYQRRKFKNNLEKAWAFFVRSQFSVYCSGRGFLSGTTRSEPQRFKNKVATFDTVHENLKKAVIENNDAINVIRYTDKPYTFFYLDPPYPNTRQDKYIHTFDEDSFQYLVNRLDTIKGKFILSYFDTFKFDYPSHWVKKTKKRRIDLTSMGGHKSQYKTECILMNYDAKELEPEQLTL